MTGDFVDLSFDRGPLQNRITEEGIRAMVDWTPRRSKLVSDWPEALHAPRSHAENWSLVLPFPETFQNAFKTMCSDVNHYAHIGKDNRCCIFLNDSQWNQESVERAKAWITAVGEHVAIRDCLALSFALDYRMEGGDPQKLKSFVGELCRRAKPYEGNPKYDKKAAKQLADLCVAFLKKMTCYESTDCIVAMPPSRPDKPFDLPRYLAGEIAAALKMSDECGAAQTAKRRYPLKGTSVQAKLDELKGTIAVTAKRVKGKCVLIIDDLYQSGTSVNYLGMLLLEAGAKKVFSLACEKTVGNFDNLGNQ